MNLVFEKVTWKNFLSTGKNSTTVDLQKATHTLIVGENGAGKSTIIDALTFALYNKPFRDIGKPELVNSINGKDCVVELELTSGGVPYKIVRGIKPSVFEIYQNGILIKQDAAARDYQKWLEANVLKMNFKAFSQIVVLGSDSYIPFMRLKSSRRREVIEEILDIEIFSSMNAILKRKFQSNREALETNRMSLTVLEERYSTLKKHVNVMMSDKEQRKQSYFVQWNDAEEYINEQLSEIKNLKEKIEEKKSYIANDVLDTARSKLTEFTNLYSVIKSKKERADKMSSFMKSRDECPTCTQVIDPQYKQTVISQNDTAAHECVEGLEKIAEKIDQIKIKISEYESIQKDISNLEKEISAARVRIEGKKGYQSKLSKMMEDVDIEITAADSSASLEKVEKDISDSKKERVELIEYKKYLDFSQMLLRDDGIKAKEIRRYLPLINTQINKHLQDMDCYVNFTLDENFEEIIKSRHRDKFTYNSFSAGERLRIDLALLFTWREVAARKNSVNTNLLIMDEVFDSSLDSQGTEEFLKIIKTSVSNTNVFVISHRNEFLYDKFEDVIRFEKIKNFSHIIEQ
jgi:DNA repair exonuclease SbcCD ATPase subunit